jgi:hypothetical protein
MLVVSGVRGVDLPGTLPVSKAGRASSSGRNGQDLWIGVSVDYAAAS